jgi:hypothetical protein
VPAYSEDVGITETNKSVVEAYTDLTEPSQIYDAFAVYRLSEEGIKLGQIATRSGNAIEFGDFSGRFKATNAALISKTGNTFYLKSSSMSEDGKYNTLIANPPATWKADSTEVITINIEDGDGDSSVTIVGGRGEYEIWKIPTTTASVDYDTGTKVGDFTTANNKFRFIGDASPGFDYLTLDTITTVKDRYPSTKGVYTHSMFSGAEIQLAQAPQVIENGIKLDLLANELTTVIKKENTIIGLVA